MVQFIQVTAQYSNAVLVAILPQISDFSQKLDLPIPTPVTLQQVRQFNCDSHRGQVGGWLFLTNGFQFWYGNGFVEGFKSPDCYYSLQDPAMIQKFFGVLKMNESEAIQLARDTLRKVGYSETALYADGKPIVTKPPRIGTNVVPRFNVRWIEPVDGDSSAEIEIDGTQRKVKSVVIMNRNVARDPPAIAVQPEAISDGQVPDFIEGRPDMEKLYKQLPVPVPVSSEQKRALLIKMLPRISDYAHNLGLPISLPLTTNQVASFVTDAYPYELIVNLTNGCEFTDTRGYVIKFRAPYSFFGPKLDGRVEEYWGEWRMTEKEAAVLARNTIRKLGFAKALPYIDKPPEVKKPLKLGTHNIPRYRLNWYDSQKNVDGAKIVRSATEIEVDAATKTVKSIIIYDPYLARNPISPQP